MFAVTVTFRVHPGRTDAFLPLVVENARVSLAEEQGCRQFDVCRDGAEVFLYEIYDDRAAFDAHLLTEHFLAFDKAATDLVADKQVRVFGEVIR